VAGAAVYERRDIAHVNRLLDDTRRAQSQRFTLERSTWNQTRAAALLGLNRDQIRYRIEKFKLERSVL
jgi:transcriptional regulator with GAF, ATPase, and Fis domain